MGGTKLPFSDAGHAASALATCCQSMRVRLPMATLGELAQLLPAATIVGDAATPIVRVHSDTRSIARGDLFVALRGERFDAHDFLSAARDAGAVAALAERGRDEGHLPGLVVADTRAALGDLAAAWRKRFAMPLVASPAQRQTTVTQMIAAIFRAWQGDARSRPGQLQQRHRRAADPAAHAPGCRAAVIELA